MHVYATFLDTPEDFEPNFHVNYQSKLPWLALADDLPKFNGTMLGTPAELWSDRSQTNDP